MAKGFWPRLDEFVVFVCCWIEEYNIDILLIFTSKIGICCPCLELSIGILPIFTYKSQF